MDDNILHDNILRESAVCLFLRTRYGKQDLSLAMSYMYAGIKWQPGCLGTLLCSDLVKILLVPVISLPSPRPFSFQLEGKPLSI